MNRKDFLKSLGLTGASAFAVMTLGCSSNKTGTFKPTNSVDFTIDLNDPYNVPLKTPGNYIILNQVVIANNNEGNYVAATLRCSHAGKYEVTFRNTTDTFYCTEHGAEYDLAGKGLNSNGSGGLTIYKTQLNGTLLRIYN